MALQSQLPRKMSVLQSFNINKLSIILDNVQNKASICIITFFGGEGGQNKGKTMV